MKIIDLNKKHNDIDELSNLSDNRYENIFNMGTNNNYFFYNIIKTIKFPEELDSSIFDYKIINQTLPYTAVSYNVYGTQNLWWLILLSNNITNPVDVITPGTRLKIIKSKFVKDIINTIIELNNA
tara:strand:+ start:358 stop:732 length:375 start_codon:yes stop_codon:yes gene_type:complete